MIQIPPDKFKEMLVTDGIVLPEQFDEAFNESQRMARGVADILFERNIITERYYYDAAARYYGVEQANLGERQIDEAALRLLPEDMSRQKRAIVFAREADGSLDVAMEDPSDLVTIEFLEGRLNSKVRPFLASPDDLGRGLTVYSKKAAEDFRREIEDSIRQSLRSGAQSEQEAATGLPVVTLTDSLLAYAIASRASDIHLEVLEDEVLVRFRVDGILHEIMRVPKDVHQALVARIKLLSGLKLDEHYKPQDGRFRHKIGADIMDLRVSVMPTFYGEKVEMRLLASTERPLSFEELGLFPEHVEQVKQEIKKTFGTVLVTGPTGSGKTTTLYSVISALNATAVNVATIEDPIEYSMKYINQTQVNPAAGITFASGLRALLRQDPNIIMVGEIRDEETAEIAVHAALTGHLVLSTLHTNDAPTAIPRLVDLKVAAFLVAAVLNAVLAQRLVRRICMTCITSYKVADDMGVVLAKQIKRIAPDLHFSVPRTLFRGEGCDGCGGTGFRGRMGIFELLTINEEMRRQIVQPDFTLDAVKKIARNDGFITMFEDGLRKVERGMTTIEEVLRVVSE